MPTLHARDPLSPAFWDERFAHGITPWERGAVPQALRAFALAHPGRRCLIPGCGAGRELAFLSQAGWDALAIDFSHQAAAAARGAAGPWAARVEQADFFQFAPSAPFDTVYERAFLCAMPPAIWSRVAARWAALLAPGALLIGYFLLDHTPRGPPYGIERAALEALLCPAFICLTDQDVRDSIPVFAGRERWMVWRRLAD
ncbi:MAG: methyltransferase domain-containing protein [Pseudomonadota bacterium]